MNRYTSMRRYITFLTLLLVPLLSFGAAQRIEPLNAPTPTAPGDIIDETSDRWFVELASKPAVEGTRSKTLKREKANFRSAAKKAGLQYTERFAFDSLFNGLSVKIDPADLGKLARIPGVVAVYPVFSVTVPQPSAPNPDLFTAIAMSGADIAQSSLGLTGAGIKVAVMDTGIDYDHPDLGGCFGEGCRVAYGYDFVGDDYDAEFNPTLVPDDDPDDCQGHGTHVSGIVGASGVVTGVAPGVTFGAYRVFGCNGSTDTDIMMAAMERALADGMDVLNMSIGSSFAGWPQYPTAAASDRMVNKGMVVVASIGNSGADGTYSNGAPGVGKKTIGVASYDNTRALSALFEVNANKVTYNGMSFALPAPTSGTEEIVNIGRACSATDTEIADPILVDPAGKVALIVRGACSFGEKAANALAEGATAAVIYNSNPGNFNGTLGSAVDIVAVSISDEDGAFILEQTTPTMMTWTDQLESSLNPTGGLISSFSSYGLAADLSLKPDIGAPGGSIYSTYVMEKSDYATLGGTSMASPHVAGSVALLLEAHPNTSPQAVRRILQNSADPAEWSLLPGYGYLDSVHRQGAGMIDIDDSILATTRIEPGKISLGESEAGVQVHTLTLENNGHDDVTYDLMDAWWAIDTTGTFASQLKYWLSDQYLEFSAPSVTVPAGGTASVDVTFYPATSPDLGTFGGYIGLQAQDGSQSYSVPYAGFIGDYQELSVLYNNPFGLPRSVGCETDCTMVGNNVPEFFVNFGHQARKFRMTIRDAATGKNWHRAYDLNYLGRNSAENFVNSYKWDGTTVNGKKVNVVPDGAYIVEISVLKALGEDDNPDHWETWTSPVITIARP